MSNLFARTVAPSATPAFTHDCDRCRFVGRLDGEDLYVCANGEYARRFGNEGHEYGSLGDMAPEGSPYNLIRAIVARKLPPRVYVTVERG